MIRFFRLLLFPFALIYGSIAMIRNWFFDWGLFNIYLAKPKVISVGNLSTGGTGKTPVVEYLIKELKKDKKVAVLSRGYGRETSGLVEVNSESTANKVGDECLQIKKNFPDVRVFVCERREEGLRHIEAYTDAEIVILDDAYQHRYVYRDCNILLTDYNRPYYKDFPLPTGDLREFAFGKKRADVVLVTKSPQNLEQNAKETLKRKLNAGRDQPIYFASNTYGELTPLFDRGKSVSDYKDFVVLSGIARGVDFKEEMSGKFSVSKHIDLKDHVTYNKAVIEDLRKSVGEDMAVITTQKDAVKLSAFENELAGLPIFVVRYGMHIEESNEFMASVKSNIGLD